jgi:hypothetical protein
MLAKPSHTKGACVVLVVHAARVFILSLPGLLVLYPFVGLAQGQPDAVIALAKKHYQAAEAALKKSDWQTATGELQLAAKLAPENALIHYDLALAYSHTGQRNAAQTELKTALDIGLPQTERPAAQDLANYLGGRSGEVVGTSKTQAEDRAQAPRHSPVDASVRTLNSLIGSQLGAVTHNYHPYGFTFERSTGKLWWLRSSNAFCNANFVTVNMSGARLPELEADSVKTEREKDGQDQLIVSCKNGAACIETWGSPDCGNLDDFQVTTPSSVETLEKTILNKSLAKRDPDRAKQSLRFMAKDVHLIIATTGDPDATEKAILLMTQLISKAGPPSKAFLAESARQQAEAKAEEERKLTEKTKATQELADKINTKLSQLEGHWRATDGSKFSQNGLWANQWAPSGTNPGAVDVWEETDYDLVMGSPTDGRSTGTYSSSNQTWRMLKSGILNLDYVCFYVGSSCVKSYRWDTRQLFDVSASGDSNGAIRLKITHVRCDGTCDDDEKHPGDRTIRAAIASPYLLQFDGYEFRKQ